MQGQLESLDAKGGQSRSKNTTKSSKEIKIQQTYIKKKN